MQEKRNGEGTFGCFVRRHLFAVVSPATLKNEEIDCVYAVIRIAGREPLSCRIIFMVDHDRDIAVRGKSLLTNKFCL